MPTRTGNIPIAFRRGWSDWQKKDPFALARWASDHGFAALDLMNVTASDFEILRQHQLHVGSVDLLDFGQILSPDAGRRAEMIAANVRYVREMAELGAKVFFTCIIPGDPTRPRHENYHLAVECFSPIGQACADAGASLVIEGYPGNAPHEANLCCTPETLRTFLQDVPGTAVNYDPSHLIRLGVDHLRFLREFLPHVKHVHAKDTELDSEGMYEFGSQPAAFSKPQGFGRWTWRYCLPGHGQARWVEIIRLLTSGFYHGLISIELEDQNYNGAEIGEKLALISTRQFLEAI